MAIYKRNYSAYTGAVTPVWTRVLVLARYAFEEAWSSKITVGLFIVSLVPCVLSLVVIYLADNPVARALIGVHGQQQLAIGDLRAIQRLCALPNNLLPVRSLGMLQVHRDHSAALRAVIGLQIQSRPDHGDRSVAVIG